MAVPTLPNHVQVSEPQELEEDPPALERQTTQPLNRTRWATTRQPGRKGTNKRRSIFQRNMKRMSSLYTHRDSATTDATDLKAEAIANDNVIEGPAHRTIYVNQPLPPHALDEEGRPLHVFKRNKIRTAKYTPLSFIPKNLWFQLHNVANIYFIFIVVLGVSESARLQLEHALD